MAVENSTNEYLLASSKKRTLFKALAAGVLTLASIGSTGCTMTSGVCRIFTQSDCIDNCMIGYRNRVLAARAWHERAHCYDGHRFKSDFEAGFLQGYADIAKGGNGCTPAVAPAEYLGWRYQSSDGQASINAWFEGYPLGAQAAEIDGVGNWGNIRPSQSKRPKQAVFVPPTSEPAEQDVNPFYNTQPYPYEPAPDEDAESDDSEDSVDSPADNPIRDALDEPIRGDDAMELEDGGPTDSPASSVGDAIRDALDASPDEADSTSTPFGGVPQATASVGDSSPVINPNDEGGVKFILEDIKDESLERIFGANSIPDGAPTVLPPTQVIPAAPAAETAKAPALDDLPFSFE